MLIAIRSLVFVALFYLWTALVAIVATPILVLPTRWTWGMFHLWGRGNVVLLEVICNIKVEIRGRELIPQITPNSPMTTRDQMRHERTIQRLGPSIRGEISSTQKTDQR